eukprot:CAMPEP_0183292624 /NCGR_PEP_ID=MMETSP0160_2-20130417/1612_1 /TAXON_ID=2839 ORGANISM="Odontella Sinensis, Strain Grunow 1884" /NCGR_SAMPLE_ID=MMETSP0160_2 /ASSEMBLY_ACC=CAM_ASM_000250 /LENGTH=309 /DNA_ID=CAMNT_0025453605 /DNA_START=69 /DNA_END=998 /DNA_ORIENTATION=+
MKTINFLLAAASAVGASAFFATSPNSRTVAPSISRTFGAARRPRPTPSSSSSLCMKHTLVLIRHGESTWNKENLFTGWVDVSLSEKGREEASAGGKLLKEGGYTFDVAYTSVLKRAIQTLWLALEELDLMYIPIVNTWRLNERHYGGLQGLNKQETVDKHGKDQVLIWRRSYDVPPPLVDRDSEHHPSNDPRYAGVDFPDEFTESLKTTSERFLPDWENVIGPRVKAGEKVLIAAHGNTLRALVKHLDGISEEEICGLNIPTGVPLVYELDDDLNVIPHPDAIAPLQGLYLGNLEEVRARIEGVANQTK